MKSLTVKELKEKLDQGEELLVIDIREEWEVNESNFGAKHILMDDIIKDPTVLPKDETVVLHCRSGNRSGKLIQYLQDKGFDNLINLEGGNVAWQEQIGTKLGE